MQTMATLRDSLKELIPDLMETMAVLYAEAEADDANAGASTVRIDPRLFEVETNAFQWHTRRVEARKAWYRRVRTILISERPIQMLTKAFLQFCNAPVVDDV